MTNSEFYLGELIKEKLIVMAIDCTLPSDFNELDMSSIISECTQSEEYQRHQKIERLGQFLSCDTEDIPEVFDLMEERVRNGRGDEMSVYDFDVVKSCENLTISEILDLL